MKMSSWESQLAPQEAKYYMQLFHAASKTQDGVVTGTEAVRFFASSGVPNEILSEIWEAADNSKVGYLTPETFAIALKLIACAQHGKEASADILSTVVPFPQFEGVDVIAPSPNISNNTPLSNTPTPLAGPLITDLEREKYISIFNAHQPNNGVLDANTAKNIFLKSKLSMESLSQIWYLADVRQSGTLNQAEFVIAMHYIAKLMDGTLAKLPDKLPPTVYQSALGGNTSALVIQSPLMHNMSISSPSFHNARQQSMMTPPQRARTIDSLGDLAFGSSAPIHEPIQQWDVTAQEKQQFDIYFDKIDSNKTNVIQGKEAVEFFKNSRLPESELAHIWDLADIQQRGALSREEFAVAMHLIHKRLSGETLPQTLPKTLIPPQNNNNTNQPIQKSPFDNSPSFSPEHTVISTPQQSQSLIDNNTTNDLLGDFGNDQISHETNQANLMQNQISSLTSQTTSLNNQKITAENTLKQLSQQKKELEAQLTDVRMTHEAAVKDLNEIQEAIRREESEWDKIRSEYDASQEQLNTVQNEIEKTKQTLENGRTETESLRRRVHEIQEQIAASNAELDNLRGQTKQQSMMLDINRRQVTAAEQDRALARRHLEDYKAAGDLNKDESDSGDEEELSIFADANEQPTKTGEAAVPNTTSSVASTPSLNNTFDSPIVPIHTPKSTEFDANNKSSSVFDAFSPSIATGAIMASDHNNNNTSVSGDDFDAIFGTFGASPSTNTETSTPALAFDPSQWNTAALTTTPTSPHTKTSRTPPPPPPPQSRHHRQPSESVSSIASITSPSNIATTKKQRAPPPPPPPASSTAAAASYVIQDQGKESDDDDDFEAAFSGKQLPEARIITKDDELAEFDDAFKAFDIKPAPSVAPIQASSATNKDNWASSFGGFNFPGMDDFAHEEPSAAPTTTTTVDTKDNDWDAIFGVTSSNDDRAATTNTGDTAINNGFDDAFSSFSDDFGKQPKAESNKPTSNSNTIGVMGDKIEELVKMGFNEKDAKDALNRYDQDLEKASNFLLDHSSKQ
ncbi:MAG: hypothetical protein EXX96DRAFT_570431 [Benjaminiella poitrasii]|nr:MAG: hypothetical protein EXX96DRAFT_570431 [Benjaminiella poitrasii]